MAKGFWPDLVEISQMPTPQHKQTNDNAPSQVISTHMWYTLATKDILLLYGFLKAKREQNTLCQDFTGLTLSSKALLTMSQRFTDCSKTSYRTFLSVFSLIFFISIFSAISYLLCISTPMGLKCYWYCLASLNFYWSPVCVCVSVCHYLLRC